MSYLLFNGRNLIDRIPKSELIAKASRIDRIGGMYSKDGADTESLKVDVVNYEGCSYFTNPFSFKYDWRKEEAVVLIDWNSLEMLKSKASIVIRLTANYHFTKTIPVHIIKVDSYFNFVPQNNLKGRGKLHIGTLQVVKICEDGDAIGTDVNQHRIEIGKEIDGIKNVFVTISDANHLAKSDILAVPFNENRFIKIFMDFGENGIKEPLCYTFSFMLNGEKVTFGTKKVTINPYIPQLTHRIELDRNEDGLAKQNLQDGSKTVGKLFVGSDAIYGEQPIQYSLITDSNVLKIGTESKNKSATISPLEEDHCFPLVFHGNELSLLPESPIQVRVLNEDIEIESIFLVKKTNDEENANQIVLTAPSFAKINKEEKRSVTVYFGNKETVELPLMITKEPGASNVSVCLKPADNGFAEIDTATTTNYPFAHKGEDYSIKINVAPIEVGTKNVSVCASAPYHKDASCVIAINCKEKKTPKIKFSFIPSKLKYGLIKEGKVIVYKNCEEEKIGEMTLQCCAENGVQKPRKEHYKSVNLESDLIVLPENISHIIHLTQKGELKEHKTDISIGDSVCFDVVVEPIKSDYTGEIDLSFKCFNDCANNFPKVVIKEQVPEDIPAFSFNPELGIIYPVNQELIKVGTISIQLPEQKKGNYKRENGSIYFEENCHFYFSNEFEKQEQCHLINRSDKTDIVSVYFDANQYFDCAQNIEKEETIQLHLKYKDENVDKELILVPADSEKWEFVVKPYPAEPILEMVFVDAKGREKVILFDDSFNAEVEVAEGIQYTQAMKSLPPGRKFKLKVKNSQTICLPKKYIKLSEIKSDKEFILIDANDEYCIYNGGNEEIIDIKIDWSKIKEGCSCFTITGKVDDNPMSIKVCCPIYETVTTNWRSLDLGTSAIVLAEMHRENIKTVIDTINLSDTDRSLEQHKDMISSTIALYNSEGNDFHDLLLSPERMKYNQATAILPAVKFLVGQTKLPFLESYRNRGISKLKGKYLEAVDLNDKLHPEAILESIYKDIFSRMGGNAQDETKKLILTYPSTYTIEQRSNLKDLILNEFKNLQEQNLDFVAESDAVLAQYLYSKRISVGDAPLTNGEKILIYDMGAGTLDISYVLIKIENEGKANQITKAIIEKRIGIPVAGNHLDYCIFKYLEPFITEKELEQPQALKKNIQELKKAISDNTDKDGNVIGNVSNITLKTDKKETISYQEIIESDNLKEFFKKCSEGVFELLLGDNWANNDVTFVYSGRGCLFKPLINYIKDKSGWTPEPVADSPEEMKLCAARGAIRYVQIFSKNAQQPFVIESFKYYASFGLVYRSYEKDGKTETYKCEILKTSDDFKTEARENLHTLVSGIDIRPVGPLILVQSYLTSDRIAQSFNNKHLKKEDDDGCYISEIFRVFREDLGLDDAELKHASVDFSIDDFNDTIKCIIMGQPLNDYKFSESIENDVNYRNSMWPFNN